MGNNIRLGKPERRRGRLHFSLQGFQFYQLTKGFLTCLNGQVEYSLSDHLNLNKFTTLLIEYYIVRITLLHGTALGASSLTKLFQYGEGLVKLQTNKRHRFKLAASSEVLKS